MRPIASGDIETDPFKPGRLYLQPFLAGWYDGHVIRKFWGEKCLHRCFESFRHFDGIIYFHNGGKFDFHHFIDSGAIPFDAIVPESTLEIHGRISCLKIINGPELIDSYLSLPVGLAAHGKEDIDYRIMEKGQREKTINKKRINSYFDTDLISLFDFVSEFIDEYGSGLTLATRAFAKAKELCGIKKYPKTNEYYDEKYRRFYHGGRCEFFRLGKVPFKVRCYDLNSAFPFAMLQNHEWGTHFEIQDTIPKERLSQSFLRVRGHSNGAFPFITKEGLEFPKMSGEWCVTGWEYQAAIETGNFKLQKVIAVHVPEELKSFGEYVHHFYNLKKNAETESDRIFAKLMLNSFYGRFALNPRKHRETLWLPYGETPKDYFGKKNKESSEDWEILRYWNARNLVLWGKEKPPEKWRFFDVALAASITGHARANLFRSICRVTNPVYCDTDSIFCEDGSGLDIGPEIGQWKEEASGEMWIAGKKLYALKTEEIADEKLSREWEPEGSRFRHWKTAHKGVNLSAVDIVSIAEGETKTVTFDVPSYSLFSEPSFTKRTIKRADLRKEKRN